ncbi:hypothetical protein Pmani_007416 [Petrolisthes manimaculis]|uniref:Uncharacterized protein n=1 Tax=Petrolisthes manimaculis TaxID=1843537 RepID=A0AAE1Q7M8_9EUCA|nr:hypothetical protein Pmani_007416 [Petrolisthes manimaculis]
MIPLLLTALLLALAHCEPLLEPMEELESMDMNMGYENEVMNETDLDQKEAVCPSGCCTQGSKCEKLGGECQPLSSLQWCHHASTDPDLCGSSKCRCCLKCSCGSYCGKVYGTCRPDCGCSMYEYADVFNPCPAPNGCTKHKGRCLRKGVKCPTGYTSFSCWCKNESTCHCCIPTKTAKNLSLKCTS